MRAVEMGGAGVTGLGIDNDQHALTRARALATVRGLDRRVDFVHAESATWKQRADRVLCIGASHAWADVESVLNALAQVIREGGRVLFGEGFWERPPTPAAAALFDDVMVLPDIVRLARSTGWQVLHVSTADQREWDDFEATWRSGRQQWLLNHPYDDRSRDVQVTLDAQLQDYIEVYRGVLGFGYLVLAR